MIPTIFGFLLICMAIQAFGYIIGMGAIAVKEVQAHHRWVKTRWWLLAVPRTTRRLRSFALDVPRHRFRCVDGMAETQ